MSTWALCSTTNYPTSLKRIILIIIWILSKREPKEEEPIPVEPTPVEPIEPKPVEEIKIVDDVDVATADELMTDDQANTMVTFVSGAGVGTKNIINIDKLNDAFSAGDEVTLEKLKAMKLVPASTKRLKVLADGHLNKPLKIYAEQFSVQAIKMIVLTGGEAIVKK